jgi:hypothetical protein
MLLWRHCLCLLHLVTLPARCVRMQRYERQVVFAFRLWVADCCVVRDRWRLCVPCFTNYGQKGTMENTNRLSISKVHMNLYMYLHISLYMYVRMYAYEYV